MNKKKVYNIWLTRARRLGQISYEEMLELFPNLYK